MAIREGLRRLRDLGLREDTPPSLGKHIRATNAAAVAGTLLIGTWAIANAFTGQGAIAVQNAVAAAIYLAVLGLSAAGRYVPAAVLLNATLFGQIAWAIWTFGASSNSAAFFPGSLVLAYLSVSRKHRWVAHAFAIAYGLGFVAATVWADALPPRVRLMEPYALGVLNAAVSMLTFLVLTAIFVRAVDAGEDALIAAEQRVDQLLLNTLPRSVVARLKRDPDAAIADAHAEVTVLFADIVGFTPLASRLSPEQTVDMLSELFGVFDAICEEEGALRIKTMGDGYLAVCGAPEPREDHAERMVHVAQRMRAHMASDAVDASLQVRIGLNSGPVIAGIIGRSRFAYDLWGDAVNVASRMESSGVPGEIQLAEPTYLRVRDRVDCRERGVIEVKGKGPMPVWFVA